MSGTKILDRIEIDGRGWVFKDIHTQYIDIYDNSLSRKWLTAFNHLLKNNYHLEKNYCWMGLIKNNRRNGIFILNQLNRSIEAINQANLGYTIDDSFSMDNCISDEPTEPGRDVGRNIVQSKFNQLHRYFEDLQGVAGAMSPYYTQADWTTRWHIRQLNLLCHEFESWALSYRKEIEAPEWQRPSQLMCWLNAPRFELDAEDYELFGIDTINRSLGGVYLGVNKAIGKHHWEVFNDEGRDSRISELTTSTLRSQTLASGDFDIEWGNNPGNFPWQQQRLAEFREWLTANGFDPDDKALTIGHPQIGQIDLERTFGTSTDFQDMWFKLSLVPDVCAIRTSDASATFNYSWTDHDYMERQIRHLEQGN